MRYSKSLDLVISALTFGARGDTAKAAQCFDKALAMKDLGPTLKMLNRASATAHTQLLASLTAEKKPTTTAQYMAALAAKRHKAQLAGKLPFPGAAPPFKKKSESDAESEDDDEESDEDEAVTADAFMLMPKEKQLRYLKNHPKSKYGNKKKKVKSAAEDEDEDDDEDDDSVSEAGFKDYSADKKARYLLNHPKSKWHSGKGKKKVKSAADDEDESEDEDESSDDDFGKVTDDMTKSKAAFGKDDGDDDEDDSDLDLDGISDDAAEMPEASLDDVDTGFNDTMENTDPSRPSVDGEGEPGDENTETSEADEDEDEDEDDDFGDLDDDEESDEDEAVTADAFMLMPKEKQLRYLKNHPKSKYGSKKKAKKVVPKKKKAKANLDEDAVTARVKRIQANLQALDRLSMKKR